MAESQKERERRAAELTERIGDACVEALLNWGEAVNAYEATPAEDKSKALRLTIAQATGGAAMELGKKLASRLRPRKG
jgi:hypothetical protein